MRCWAPRVSSRVGRVSREEWRTYVETIHVRENFPGINGLGWIQPVASAELEFVAEMRADGAPDFATTAPPTQALTTSSPSWSRKRQPAALGLNIAFEEKRLTRRSGRATRASPR